MINENRFGLFLDARQEFDLDSLRLAFINSILKTKAGGKHFLCLDGINNPNNSVPLSSPILDDLAWLDVDWEDVFTLPDFEVDCGKSLAHQQCVEIATTLLEQGNAYRCFCEGMLIPNEDGVSKNSQSNKCKCSEASSVRQQKLLESSAPFCVKLRLPVEHPNSIDDLIQGKTEFIGSSSGDPTLLRQNGSPTRILAEAFFSHQLHLSYIIRVADRLNLSFYEQFIYQYMDWQLPEWGHVSFLQWDNGQALSINKAGTQVRELREEGYLPEALRSVLLGDVLPSIDTLDMNNLKILQNLPIKYSRQNLLNTNRIILNEINTSRLEQYILPFVQEFIPESEDWSNKKLSASIGLIRGSAPTLRYMTLNLSPIVAPELDPVIFREYYPDGKTILVDLLSFVASDKSGTDQDKIAEWLKLHSDDETLETVRFALTGRCSGPSVVDILEFLGEDEFIRRLRHILGSMSQTASQE